MQSNTMEKSLSQGRITFRSDPAKISAIQAYMAASIYDLKWDLSMGRYVLWGFREQVLAGNILSVGVHELSLKNNQMSFLQEIASIRFLHLKKISLDTNKIESIETLASLNAPLLQHLSLSKNHLSSIKPLRRCNFQSLRILQLKENKIVDLNALDYCHFPHLKDISLESASDSPPQAQDLSSLCKSNFDLNWIFAVSQLRAVGFDRIFHKRWPNCEIRCKNGGRRRPNIVLNLVQW